MVKLQFLPFKNKGDVFFFSNIAVSWSRGRSADKEHTCSIYAEIVIHQTKEQVITNEGIQENTWGEVVVVVGGRGGGAFKMVLMLFVGKQPCSVRT